MARTAGLRVPSRRYARCAERSGAARDRPRQRITTTLTSSKTSATAARPPRRRLPTSHVDGIPISDVTEYSDSRSIRLDVCELDHLRPLVGIVSNEPPEFRGRTRRQLHASKADDARFDGRVGDGQSNFLAKQINDFGGRISRGTKTNPSTRFVIWDEFSYCRNIGQ